MTAMLDLGAIKARLTDATPGPWHAASVQHGWAVVYTDDNMPICDCDHRRDTWKDRGVDTELMSLNDAVFIAQARTDIELLIAEIERLRHG